MEREKQKCFVRVKILTNVLVLFLFVGFNGNSPDKAKSGSCYTKESHLPIPNTNAAEQPRCLLQFEAAMLQALGKLMWCLAKASHIK